MDRIDGNEADTQILIEVLVGSDVTPAALEAHFHIELAAFADGCNVDIFIQYLDVAVGFDHARGDDTGLIGAQVNRFRCIACELKRNLLEVENDIRRILDYAGDRLEFVQHALDFHGSDGSSLNRAQQHTAQRIADGGAEAALKGLRPEHSVLVGKRSGIGGETFWFLKPLPKHVFLLRPCGSMPAS